MMMMEERVAERHSGGAGAHDEIIDGIGVWVGGTRARGGGEKYRWLRRTGATNAAGGRMVVVVRGECMDVFSSTRCRQRFTHEVHASSCLPPLVLFDS